MSIERERRYDKPGGKRMQTERRAQPFTRMLRTLEHSLRKASTAHPEYARLAENAARKARDLEARNASVPWAR